VEVSVPPEGDFSEIARDKQAKSGVIGTKFPIEDAVFGAFSASVSSDVDAFGGRLKYRMPPRRGISGRSVS